MTVAAALAAAGFDIAHAFDGCAVAAALELPALADPDRPCGLIVGNTRALWPRFLAALAADPALSGAADPIERYTEARIDQAVSAIDGARVWFSHRRYPAGANAAFLPMQRLAVAAGLGSLAPTQLVIHPTYGPWFALRAVILHPGVPVLAAPIPPACRCDGTCEAALATALAATGPDAWRAWVAVRDSCKIGHNHRYSDDQLAYHYTSPPPSSE